MVDEQTNTPDTQGTATPATPATPDEPLSLYQKTEAIVTRQEAANKKTEELIARQETLHANDRLAGTSGGRVEPTPPVVLSDEDYSNKLMKGEANPMKDDGISL